LQSYNLCSATNLYWPNGPLFVGLHVAIWTKGKTLSHTSEAMGIDNESNSGRQQLNWNLKARR